MDPLGLDVIPGSGNCTDDKDDQNIGVVQSRINITPGSTRFTPLRSTQEPVSAGFDHIIDGHFDRPVANNRSIFSIEPSELKSILQDKSVIQSPVIDLGDGHFVRVADINKDIGYASLNQGGGITSKLKIITDKAGNLITAYPIK